MGKWSLLDDGAVRVHVLFELPLCTFRNKVKSNLCIYS